VLYDLAADARALPEGQTNAPSGARDGKNDFGKTGWSGPCPPIGRHRYFHKVYGLDVVLPDLGQPAKADLVGAMNGHLVAQGELVATYQKGQ
jgi:Raf kinase inhibitor-like YbhB/YbcL family protein